MDILGLIALAKSQKGRSASEVPYHTPGVKFIDYDGTVVRFVGREEVLQMKKLPDAPTHVGFTARGWNWTLTDIKSYMTKCPDAIMTVGQMYVPSDGKTHMILDVGPRLTVPIVIQQTISEGVTINWGDGSDEETIEGIGTVTTSHTYVSEGEYEITLEVADGCELSFGGTIDGINYNVFQKTLDQAYITSLKKVFVGNGVLSIGQQAFSGCLFLTSFTIPDSITSIGQQAFISCYSLTSLIIPNSIISIDQFAFSSCYSLTSLTIPNSVTSIGQIAFNSCYSLMSLTIPDSITSIGQQVFLGCYSLTSLTIPNNITSIGQNAFRRPYNLYTLTILAETPPTLANVNAFDPLPADCTIYVPYGKGDTYKSASGWSTWASQIQELPE